jgi:hypothetical protein
LSKAKRHKWYLVEGTFRCRRCGAVRRIFWRGRWRLTEFRFGDADWKTKAPECNCQEQAAKEFEKLKE